MGHINQPNEKEYKTPVSVFDAMRRRERDPSQAEPEQEETPATTADPARDKKSEHEFLFPLHLIF